MSIYNHIAYLLFFFFTCYYLRCYLKVLNDIQRLDGEIYKLEQKYENLPKNLKM